MRSVRMKYRAILLWGLAQTSAWGGQWCGATVGACGLLLSGSACSTPVASSRRVARSAPPATAGARVDGDAGSTEAAPPTTSGRECEPGAARYSGDSFCGPVICRKDGRWAPALALFCPAWAYFEPGSSVLLLEEEPRWLPVAVQTVVTGTALQVSGIVPRRSRRDARAQALAQKRAEAVRDLLIERGAPADRLSVRVVEAPPVLEGEKNAKGWEVGAAVTLPETAAPPP
jgi:hypothetical protein